MTLILFKERLSYVRNFNPAQPDLACLAGCESVHYVYNCVCVLDYTSHVATPVV